MIYVICGPTGSGKTSLAIELAEHFSCPIINADAFQIYRDMNIGTAKISSDDTNYKKHYLLDIISPEDTYSVKEYQDDFRKILAGLINQYENIIVCGGTGLYIRAALYDYSFEEHDSDDTSDLEKLTNDELWNMLLKLDEPSTHNIHPNNRKRVIRAISIARTNKISKSENISNQSHKMIYDNVRIIMLNPNRELLYENINKRVDLMFELGLVEEVKELLNKYSLSNTAEAAIGYKEVIDYLKGGVSLEDTKELIKKRTRNYAKRQVTFFKNQFDLEMYETKEMAKGAIIHD